MHAAAASRWAASHVGLGALASHRLRRGQPSIIRSICVERATSGPPSSGPLDLLAHCVFGFKGDKLVTAADWNCSPARLREDHLVRPPANAAANVASSILAHHPSLPWVPMLTSRHPNSRMNYLIRARFADCTSCPTIRRRSQRGARAKVA
ncbi:hypothetical protein L209DRAFT_751200 [Thermothelomyces heterothallicus CBS 203.75]